MQLESLAHTHPWGGKEKVKSSNTNTKQTYLHESFPLVPSVDGHPPNWPAAAREALDLVAQQISATPRILSRSPRSPCVQQCWRRSWRRTVRLAGRALNRGRSLSCWFLIIRPFGRPEWYLGPILATSVLLSLPPRTAPFSCGMGTDALLAFRSGSFSSSPDLPDLLHARIHPSFWPFP